jgi:hypothetical protein
MLLDIALFRRAPELASLEILAGVLYASTAALTAVHPCLEYSGAHCRGLAPCRFAWEIHNSIGELENAILKYRGVAEAALEDEQDDPPSF